MKAKRILSLLLGICLPVGMCLFNSPSVKAEGDTTVNFENRGTGTLTGSYGGINWGNSDWYTSTHSAPYSVEAWINSSSTDQQTRTIKLPAGKVLKSLKIRACNPGGWPLVTLSSSGNSTQSFTPMTTQYVYDTDWKMASASVTIQITAGNGASDINFDDIVYGDPGTTSPDGATITVNPSESAQTIEGISGNLAINRMSSTGYTDEYNDPVGTYNLDTLQPPFARVGIPIVDWEPANDNSDSNDINWAGFSDTGYVHQDFLLMQDLQSRGIAIVGSVWDVPDWMVSNPSSSTNRLIKTSPDLYPEVAESIAAFVSYAKSAYNVDISYLSFNESNDGNNVQFTSEEYAKIVKLTGDKLAGMGFPDIKWLVGDTGESSGLVSFAQGILSDADAAPYLGPISFHSWDVNNVSTDALSDIYALARTYGKTVWAGEVGYDPMLWERSDYDTYIQGWDNAYNLAVCYYKVFKYSGASNLFYWEYQNDFPIASDSGQPYSSYYVIKQYNDYFKPGMQLVDAQSDNANLLALAAKSDTKFSVNIINTSTSSGTITVTGIPNAAYQLVLSDADNPFQITGNHVAENNVLTVDIPAYSMITITK